MFRNPIISMQPGLWENLMSLELSLGLPPWLAVKNLPAVQEMHVQFLGWEDSLEENCIDRGAWWASP